MCADSTYANEGQGFQDNPDQSDPPQSDSNSHSPSLVPSSLDSRLGSRLDSTRIAVAPLDLGSVQPFNDFESLDEIIRRSDSNSTNPEYCRMSPNGSSSSSVTDARSPMLDPYQDTIYISSMTSPLKKVPSPKNGDPINTSDSMVSITRSRLEELEYIEKHIDEIVALNLRKYIEEHEGD
jgi:hypothetical protein